MPLILNEKFTGFNGPRLEYFYEIQQRISFVWNTFLSWERRENDFSALLHHL